MVSGRREGGGERVRKGRGRGKGNGPKGGQNLSNFMVFYFRKSYFFLQNNRRLWTGFGWALTF